MSTAVSLNMLSSVYTMFAQTNGTLFVVYLQLKKKGESRG
jgi:hypothetical protein